MQARTYHTLFPILKRVNVKFTLATSLTDVYSTQFDIFRKAASLCVLFEQDGFMESRRDAGSILEGREGGIIEFSTN